MTTDRFIGGVLVGGDSRRMGRCKALLPHAVAGTFVEHVVGVAREVASDVVLLGEMADRPAGLKQLACLHDRADDMGPIAGLDALLATVGNRWALLLACDLPLLNSATLVRLLQGATEAVDAVAYRQVGGRLHTCCALYHGRLRPTVAELMDSGVLSLQQILQRPATRILEPNDAERRHLTNVNNPEDLTKYEVRSRCGR